MKIYFTYNIGLSSLSLPNTTKLRTVYDASAKASENTVCLNKCLETGPPLQNSLYDILIRPRMRPIILCGDIQKAFWQIRITELERNLLRFHWIKNLDSNIVEINRFTRLVLPARNALFEKYINLFSVKTFKTTPAIFQKVLIYINSTRIYHHLKMIKQIPNRHTPNNYSVVILVIQKS